MTEKDDQNTGNRSSYDADNEYGLPEAEYSPVSREHSDAPVEPIAFSNSSFQQGRKPEPPQKSSSWPMWLALGAILLLAGFFIFYFVFDEKEEERVTTKAVTEPKAVVVEEPAAPAEEWKAPEPEVPAEGSVSVVSSRTGRYYMIVGSFIDGDMAADYAQKLAKDGMNAKIIEPSGTRKFYRLSVKDAEGIEELNDDLESMRATFGENVWIVKY